MRYLILTAALLLLLPLPASAQGEASKIAITSTLDGSRSHGSGIHVFYYLLWNKARTPTPLGHAYTTCIRAPIATWVCSSIYTLPYGRITALGEAHGFRRHSAIITGGTRSRRAVRELQPGYAGAEGTITTFRIGPGTYRLVFLLE